MVIERWELDVWDFFFSFFFNRTGHQGVEGGIGWVAGVRP